MKKAHKFSLIASLSLIALSFATPLKAHATNVNDAPAKTGVQPASSSGSNSRNVPDKKYGYMTYNTRNVNGVTYQKYWNHSSINPWQAQVINNSMYDWNSSSGTGVYTPMNVTYGTKAQAIIECYYDGRWSSKGVLGYAVHFNSADTRVYFENSNFSYAKVFLTKNVTNWDEPAQRRTAAHEIGHAVGVAHNPSLNEWQTIMRPYMEHIDHKYLKGEKSPTTNDLGAINYLYGGR